MPSLVLFSTFLGRELGRSKPPPCLSVISLPWLPLRLIQPPSLKTSWVSSKRPSCGTPKALFHHCTERVTHPQPPPRAGWFGQRRPRGTWRPRGARSGCVRGSLRSLPRGSRPNAEEEAAGEGRVLPCKAGSSAGTPPSPPASPEPRSGIYGPGAGGPRALPGLPSPTPWAPWPRFW